MNEYGLFLLTSQQLDQGHTFDSAIFYDEDKPLTLKDHLYNVCNRSDTPESWDNYECIKEATDDYERHFEMGFAVALVDYIEERIIKTSYPETV